MRYLALATDYDGTLAHHGRVGADALAALERLRATGRRLLLVSGRELEDLQSTFEHLALFDRAVLENGALLYHPAAKTQHQLGPPPPEEFVRALRARGVPVSVGRSIVATWEPHETTVLEVIRDLGLELHVIFNKGAVMVLPGGVNKATGLKAALKELGLSPHNVVGVGDAENDHAFFRLCECSAAVANALPAVKKEADFTTRGDHGAGVIELVDELVADDLAGREPLLTRHHVLLGTRDDGTEVRLPPYACNLLIAGSSGGGKSTLTTALLERLAEQRYQFCVVDPEGDYEALEHAVVVGGREQPPSGDQVLQMLDKPDANVVADLVGVPIADRPPFFLALLSRLQELRARTGRPHWLVVDEAHHLMPNAWEPPRQTLPQELNGVVRITVRPATVAPAALTSVDTVVALGEDPASVLKEFAAAVGEAAPKVSGPDLETGEVLVWERRGSAPPYKAKVAPGAAQRRRHSRKYATGELPPDRSFYFRGPDNKLKLRAQNLMLFLQMAEGVDDDTWLFHLRRGDYSQWFRERIKDDELADEAAAVERRPDLPADESRSLIRSVVERRYTQPAAPPLPMPETDAAPVHQ
jgi:hydroxymethylpyrimidine pyrophosphatase-like HAD family hydrolase